MSRTTVATSVTRLPPEGEPFWRELVVCPCCRARLADLGHCGACHAEFGSEAGTARLIAPESRRDLTVRFGAADWAAAERALRQAAGDPGAGAPVQGLPYHVDAGHAKVMSALPTGSAVLEIGCGGGQCRGWVRGMGHRYVGTDVSKTRVHRWLREFGGPDLLCDTHFLPFRDGSFDAVYCAAVFEHLACPPVAMAEVFRVLRPGGVFCGNASFMEPWHDWSFFHLSPMGAVALLLQAGFEPVHVWPSRGYSGFRAVPGMALAGPLRMAGLALGVLGEALHRAQMAAGRLRRRVRGHEPADETLRRFVVAGATDWVARKPAR
jgi:SAM-dependent methyltransferase